MIYLLTKSTHLSRLDKTALFLTNTCTNLTGSRPWMKVLFRFFIWDSLYSTFNTNLEEYKLPLMYKTFYIEQMTNIYFISIYIYMKWSAESNDTKSTANHFKVKIHNSNGTELILFQFTFFFLMDIKQKINLPNMSLKRNWIEKNILKYRPL